MEAVTSVKDLVPLCEITIYQKKKKLITDTLTQTINKYSRKKSFKFTTVVYICTKKESEFLKTRISSIYPCVTILKDIFSPILHYNINDDDKHPPTNGLFKDFCKMLREKKTRKHF